MWASCEIVDQPMLWFKEHIHHNHEKFLRGIENKSCMISNTKQVRLSILECGDLRHNPKTKSFVINSRARTS